MQPKQIRPPIVSAPIVLALGSNLGSRAGGPRATLEAALRALGRAGIHVRRRSRWHRTRPRPPSAQPPFLNGVALVETLLGPGALMAELHRIERRFGRRRRRRNEARILDLDIIDYRGRISEGGAGEPILPHPRVLSRLFVLDPLGEIHPAWRHPATGRAIFGCAARNKG